ncbi:DNA modification methylase [Parasphingorhabdus sp.]|uniref:DNA modification methylase n=1 Tax=Parasphingorhabdus sp. TaxID=2709688 RepID=UPI003593F96B
MHPLLPKMELVELEIDKITILDSNPRQHDDKQLDMLEKSFRSFQKINPVIVTPKYELIAGEARLIVAKRCGMKTVHALIVSHFSKAQVHGYRMADNELALRGEWSLELLGKELELISTIDLDFDLESIGFEVGEIDQLILGAAEENEDEEPAEVPSIDIERPPVSRPADIFTIGRHTVACGDSTDKKFVEKVMDGRLADAVITDQPWNLKANFISGKGRIKHADFCQAGGEFSSEEFETFTRDALTTQAVFLKPGGLAFQFIDWRSLDLMIRVGKAAIGPLVNICVWVKPKSGMGSPWRSQHEMVPVFRKEGAKPMDNIKLGKFGRNRSNIWEFSSPTGWGSERHKLEMHPTAKNEKMIGEAILDCTKRNGLILDTFLGSGTTALAAEQVGRTCVGIDLDAKYIDLAIRRLCEATGKEAVRQDGALFSELSESHLVEGVPAHG